MNGNLGEVLQTLFIVIGTATCVLFMTRCSVNHNDNKYEYLSECLQKGGTYTRGPYSDTHTCVLTN